MEPEAAGLRIGRYKLLEKIGEGGFGVVYMAEQLEPVQRRVALKIIKAGMDTRQVIARFEAERQALALMDHPNIAQVLDAGATETGRPYFVMELVKGIPITGYCDQYRLSPAERLALFIKVCHAIQHAHQKGIIHRDIKPSNVLVTLHDGEPVPKVIDFGIAKALGQKLTEKTFFTGFEQMIGTPAYMSPEQAEISGLDVDIYSLFLKGDGSLWAMGDNYSGELGDGTYSSTNRPEQIVAGVPPGYNRISVQLLSGGDVRLSYVGTAGTNYALDCAFKLAPANWVPLVTNPADAGGVLVFTNTPNPGTNNFWRIRSVP
jgi:serine/threonine protein kinase